MNILPCDSSEVDHKDIWGEKKLNSDESNPEGLFKSNLCLCIKNRYSRKDGA